MTQIFKENRRVTLSVHVLFLVLVAAIVFRILYSPFSARVVLTQLPALPDLTGQPKVLVDYIENMNEEALKSSSSDHVIGNLALAYQSNTFYHEATICYKRASELNPREWRWTYYSALIDDELGDSKATIEKLKRTLQIDPEVSQAWFRLGNAYLKTNSYHDAETAFQKVLSLKEYLPEGEQGVEFSYNGAFPLKAYASFNLGRAAFQQNKLAEAKSTLEGVLEKHPKFGPAYRLLGNVYEKLEDDDKAKEYEIRARDFESYIPPSDPMYDRMVLFSRNTAFLLKQYDLAVKRESYERTKSLMNHMLAVSPNDEEVLTKRIKLALDMKAFSIVDSLLPSFFKLCGSEEKKLIDLARYFVYRAQYEPAVILLRRATAINPKAFDAHLLFMDILLEFKQYDMGINYANELVSVEPKNAEIRNKLARMFIEQGNTRGAREQMKIAQQLSPNEEARLIMLGRIARKEGSARNALDEYDKALRANPRNVNAQLEVGNYLVDLRRWSEAIAHLQNALATSPNDLDILERYAWILAVCPEEDLSNGKKALELANRLGLRRKYTKAQEMRCGITLAAAYGRVGRFDQAVEVASRYAGWANTMRDSSYLRRLQIMIKSFQDGKPYTL